MDKAVVKILEAHQADYQEFKRGGDLSPALFDELYTYFAGSGDMPYGTQKAHDGDPYNWIADRIS